jgi:hypothetical protein
MLLNTCPVVASCIRLYPSISDQIRPTFFSASLRTAGARSDPSDTSYPSDLSDLSNPVQPSPTQSNLVQPNPGTPPPPGKEIGKETACSPKRFWRRRIKFLAIFDHLSLQPLVPLVEHRICADIVAIRDFRLLNKRAGGRSKLMTKHGPNVMKNTTWMGLLAAMALPLNLTNAQESVPASVTASPMAAGTPTVATNISPAAAEVIRLAESGVGDDVVLAYIQNSQATFNLGADDVLYLRDVGVSSVVITAMLDHDTTLRNQPPANPNPVQEPPPQPVPEEAPPDYSSTPPPDVNYFYNDLSPYGAWVELGGVGWCWQPRVVLINHGWRPYCDGGQWLNSDCGWYWQSDYSWGWAPFHYGRWHLHNRCGWVWVPDTVWAPSWVVWRSSGDFCGWAPVPPHAAFDVGFGWRFNGVRVGLNFDFGLRPDCFTFVAFHDFTHHDLGHRRLAATDVTRVYSHTTVINNFAVNNRTIVNRGIPVDRVSAATHTQIRTVAIRDSSSTPGRRTNTRGMENGTPVVYRPQLRKPSTPVNVVAQRVDERHPVIQHSTITAVRNAPTQTFTAPRSPVGSSQTVPRSEIERRSPGSGQWVPRTYLQAPQITPANPNRSRDSFSPSPPVDGRGAPVPRAVPQQQSTSSTRDSSRQVPGAYSPKGYERAIESRPMVRADSRQSAPNAAPSQARTGN